MSKKEWISAETPVYCCDPEKNVECTKTGCFFNRASRFPKCLKTTNKDYEWDRKEPRKFFYNEAKG